MKIEKQSFFSIGNSLKIPTEKIEAFWLALQQQSETDGTTPFSRYLYYFGAMIVITAMTWFMTWSWQFFGGFGVFLFATSYAIILALVGNSLWKKGLRVPGGLLVTAAVCLVPLATYGLETYLNIWPGSGYGTYQDFYTWVEGRWLFMELATIAIGLFAIRYYPFAFLAVPICIAIWFLSMDLLPYFFGSAITVDMRSWASLLVGVALMFFAFISERITKVDYAFWGYLLGTFAFWGGLTSLVWGRGELIMFAYLIINVMLMVKSILLKRTVLMVFGALGVFAYLGHLAYDLFQDSLFFPLALSAIGLAIIFFGIVYQKNQKRIEAYLLNMLPNYLKRFIEKDAS